MAQQSPVDAAKAEIIAYNEKDWNAVKTVLTPDCVYDEVATHRRMQGIEQILPGWKGWATAFPDSKGSFDSVLDVDGTVVMELTWRGTHQGSLETAEGEIAPTGKRIEIRACQVVKVANGKVNSIRHYFDMATLMQQLGQ